MAMPRPASCVGRAHQPAKHNRYIRLTLKSAPKEDHEKDMSSTQTLRCRECARTYPLEPKHICEFDFGPLEIQFDYKAISKTISRESISERPPTLWRYHELLPVDGGWDETWPVGFTPLQRAKNLGDRLGLSNLYIKNDTVNPTYSFKDRVVAVAITKAREFGFETFACASTGNLVKPRFQSWALLTTP